MAQFNPTTMTQIEQENSEGPALRSKCEGEEMDLPSEAETISNLPIAALHKTTQDVAGGIVPNILAHGRITMIQRL